LGFETSRLGFETSRLGFETSRLGFETSQLGFETGVVLRPLATVHREARLREILGGISMPCSVSTGFDPGFSRSARINGRDARKLPEITSFSVVC